MLDKPAQNDVAQSSHVVALRSDRTRLAKFVATNLKVAGHHLWPWRYRAPALIIVLLVALYLGTPAVLGPIVPAERVVRAIFVQSVVASGHVEAPFRVSVGSQITGVVADVPVEEGQTVKAGQMLVVLDDREARAAVVQAEGIAAQAAARMRQLREFTLPTAKEALDQARATLLNAQQTFDRTSQLAKSGSATKAALDDAIRVLNIAKAQVRASELQVFTSSPGGSDYVMAETQLHQARAALDTAKSRLSYTEIKAPRDGVLIARSVEKGNVVQPSTVLMTLSPFLDTQLVVQIDEKNLSYIKNGQQALVSADAYPKEQFSADVVYINPGVDIQRASVQVKLRVPHPPAYLRQDMTVSVDIETARHPDALVVSAANVHRAAGDAPWVLKITDGRVVRQPVKLGLVSGGKAEITSGLKEGDVVVSGQAELKNGRRVRPKMIAKSGT